ncbi:VOC family protein [Pseudomonas fluorescens]|nr:VOC family protein [Pseudomonas fluorescens]
MLNHAAFVAYDAAITVDFYTRVLGMELVHTVYDDQIPSTGDPFPYFHLFFRLGDGSTMAFFVAPGIPDAAPASHPAYGLFNHFAFHVDSPKELLEWKARLEGHGLEVLGPVDHKGEFLSIYFHDPNGVRLELAWPQTEDWNDQSEKAYKDLDRWCGVVDAARKEGRDVNQALIEHIRAERDQQEPQPR